MASAPGWGRRMSCLSSSRWKNASTSELRSARFSAVADSSGLDNFSASTARHSRLKSTRRAENSTSGDAAIDQPAECFAPEIGDH